MVENGKQTNRGGLLRSPGNEEQQDPRPPNQQESTDSLGVCLAQLEAVIENVEEAVIVCDAAGRPVRMNHRAMELLESDGDEHARRSVPDAMGVFELHTQEDSPISPADRPLKRVIRGEAFQNVEMHGHNKRTGGVSVLLCSGTPIRDAQGDVVLAVLTLRKVEETLEVLRQRDSGLTSVLRAAPMGIGLAVDRVILDVNDWLCEMVGYRREELIGRNSRMLYLTQEDWEDVGRQNYGQIHERSKGMMETRWRRKNGEGIDILLSSTLLDPKNPSRGVTFAALDITARKQAEHKLQDIFSLSLDMICIADLRTDRFTKVNPAFERILGYSEEELLNRPFMDFIHPDDLEQAREVLEDKLRRGTHLVHFENRFRCKDGSYRWLDWTAHPQPEQGLTYGIARDVTEQRRVEDVLRFTQFAVDHLADGAVWLTEDARFCYMNDAACQLLGYSREELMQLTLWDIDPNLTEDTWTDFWQRLKAAKSVVSEAIHRTKDGRLFPVEIRSNYVEFGGRAYNCSFARDITEQKQAEEALRFTQFAIDHSADAAFWMTKDARFFYVNEAACRALGYSRDELLKKTVYDIDPTFTEQIWSDSWRTLKAKKSNILETVHQAKDGRTFPVEIRANYVEFGGREYDCAFARDITERKRAQEALRESEERHRFLVESVNDWIWETDRNGVYTYASPQCREMLGYEPQEIVGKTPFDLMPPEEAGRIREAFALSAGQAKPFRRLENVNRRKDGSLVVLETNGVPVLDAQGKLAGYRGIDRDITERKQAEKTLRQRERQLQESERKLRTLMGNLPGMAYRCANQPDWPFEFVSEGSLALTGYEPTEMTEGAVTYGDLIHPDDRRRVWDTVQDAVRRDAPFEMEYRILARDGSEKWVFERGRAVPSDDGPPCLEGFITDITQRKQAEMALQESEERYRILLDHGFDGIFVHENFEVVQVNDRLAEMTGYTPSELMGSKTIHLFAPDSQERIRRYITTLEGGYYELELRHRDGRIVQVESFGAPCKFQGRDARIVAVRDITERKRAAQALAEKEYLLSESQRMGRIGTWSFDLETGSLKWTRETYRLYGVSPDTFVLSVEAWLNLLDPDDRKRMQVWVWTAMAGKHLDAMEFGVVLPDGSTRILSGQGELVFDENGRPVRMVGTVQDVTERRRVEETLKASEARFRSIVNSSPSGIHLYELKEDGRLVFVGANPAADEILGVGHAQLTGKTIEEAFPGLDQTDVPAQYREVARRGATWRTEQIQYDEGAIRGAFDVVAFQTEPGKMVALFNDITERKQAELALRDLSRKDEEALRVARMGHWEFDVAGETFLFNDQYYTLHGTTAQEAGGYRMTAEEFARKYVHPEDAPRISENVRKAVATDDPNFQLEGEARILRSDGKVRWVNVWFRVEKDAEGRTVRLHGVNQDITERRDAEEALRRLNEHLETLVAERTEDLTRMVTRLQQLTWELSQTEDRERKRIADILHDDVQQILAAARFHLNLLSVGTRSPEESQEILRQVKQMLKEAIEKARSLSHELSPALYQVDLAETLRWLAHHMHEKHGLSVRVEPYGTVESSSECVKALLYKVSQELLFNVVKHSGVKEAVIRVRRMGRYICLTVTDRGRGFKSSELDKTAGFGLLGIRERIQMLGGRMKIKSRPGEGCRLLIVVPDEGPAAEAG